MKICILVNGEKDGIFGRRIRQLQRRVPSFKNAVIFYRNDAYKLFSIFYFIINLIRIRPQLVYVEAVAFSGCIAVTLLKPILRFKYIISTGDDYYHIVKQFHGSFLGFFANILEKTTYRIANVITTLGLHHRDYLISKGYKNVVWIELGIDTGLFKPMPVNELKQKLGLEGFLIIGLIGSITWLKKYNYSYGWDIIEIIKILKDKPVKGLIVGDGDGLAHLKKLAESYDILDKIVFTGRVSHNEIPRYINCMDICLSTQSNDMVGKMRLPGKVCEYLACGRFVISTDVGYAQTILKDTGMLIPYEGIKDNTYPPRAANIIEKILSDRTILKKAEKGIDIARRRLGLQNVSRQLEEVIRLQK